MWCSFSAQVLRFRAQELLSTSLTAEGATAALICALHATNCNTQEIWSVSAWSQAWLTSEAVRPDLSTPGVALPRPPVEMTMLRLCVQADFISNVVGAADIGSRNDRFTALHVSTVANIQV